MTSPHIKHTPSLEQIMRNVVYALLPVCGFAVWAFGISVLALMLIAGLRERLALSDVPSVSQGAALSLMLAGMLSLAFMGFAGLGGSHG